MLGKRAFVLASLTLAMLTACAGGSGEPSRYQPPGYASVVGDGNFEVICGMSRVYVMRTAIDDFRKEDGTFMTRQEFCEGHGSDTQIR